MTSFSSEIIVEQRSPEWFTARLGTVTASEMHNILTKDKNSVSRTSYKVKLASEILSGKITESYTSPAMRFGNEFEEVAAQEYMLATGIEVRTCGFFKHHTLNVGASPDRVMLYLDGSIEIKVHELHNHLSVLHNGRMPDKYIPQLQTQLWLEGFGFADFVAYQPNAPANAQLFIQRIYRDESYILMLEKESTLFLREVEQEVEFLRNYRWESYYKK